MLKRVDHIGIAVPNIERALHFWVSGLAAECSDRFEEVPAQKVRTAFVPVGETQIELLEATAPDSPIARFLEKRGPGIHHICFQVGDILAAVARLQQFGYEMIDATPRVGAHGKLVAFVHPKGPGGVLIELSQAPAAADQSE
jgi:methylmalonyl-CoA/ethylmalonyl-CoA epimerase